jgi:hypothetical protein
VADGDGLENHCGGNVTVGSNPTPSADLQERPIGPVARLVRWDGLRRIRAHTAYAIRTTPTATAPPRSRQHHARGRRYDPAAATSSSAPYRYALKKLSIFSTAGSTYSGLS